MQIARYILMVVTTCSPWSTISGKTFATKVLPIPSSPPFHNLTILDPTTHSRLTRSAYILKTSENWSVITPSYNFRYFESKQSRRLQRTSSLATEHNCTYASNGGPYHGDGTCVGTVVVDGRLYHGKFGAQDIGFGITGGPRPSWVVGPLVDQHHAERINLTHYVTGFDWLVYDHENVALESNNTTGAERSARTAVGVDSNGMLVLVVADGCEKCFQRKGISLVDLAEVMVQENVRFAINMDGGGSSVMAKDGTVISNPTCLDIPWICERSVATVLCLH